MQTGGDILVILYHEATFLPMIQSKSADQMASGGILTTSRKGPIQFNNAPTITL